MLEMKLSLFDNNILTSSCLSVSVSLSCFSNFAFVFTLFSFSAERVVVTIFCEGDKQTNGQTEKQTNNKQTDRQHTVRQSDSDTDRQSHSHKQTNRQTNKQTVTPFRYKNPTHETTGIEKDSEEKAARDCLCHQIHTGIWTRNKISKMNLAPFAYQFSCEFIKVRLLALELRFEVWILEHEKIICQSWPIQWAAEWSLSRRNVMGDLMSKSDLIQHSLTNNIH